MPFSGGGSRSMMSFSEVGERVSDRTKFKRPFDVKASSVIAF